jgi:hypothetical protein
MECAINNTYSASLNQTTPSHHHYPAHHTLALFHVHQTFTSSHFTNRSAPPTNYFLHFDLITFPPDRPMFPLGDSLDGTQSESEQSELELTPSSIKARFLKRNLNVPYRLHLICLLHRCLLFIAHLDYWGNKRLVQRYINRSESTLILHSPIYLFITTLFTSSLHYITLHYLNHKTRYNGSISRESSTV